MSADSPPVQGRTIEVIINAHSGTARKSGVLDRLDQLFESPHATVRFHRVRKGADIATLARKAAEGDSEVVVAAGGDGTISGVASALVGTDKSLGVLPLGTFNFFSQRLGIPLDLEEAARTILEGRATEVNVGEVNERIFLNKSSVGLYPLAVRHRERMYRQYGRNRLVALISGCLALLRHDRVMTIGISTEKEERTFRSRFVFVCNNPQELDYYQIRGRHCLDQDRLAVYLPEPLSPFQMLRLGLRMFFRGLKDAEGYDALCAREMRLETRRPRLPVSIDGEVEMMTTPLIYRMRPGALRVLVPAGS